MLALAPPISQHDHPLHTPSSSSSSSVTPSRRNSSYSSSHSRPSTVASTSSSASSSSHHPPPPLSASTLSASSSRASHPDPPPPRPPPPVSSPTKSVDIHTYPSQDLLRLLASLLTQIAAANDHLPPSDPSSQPSVPPSEMQSRPIWTTLTTASRSALSTPSSPLSFHARNIPSISLEAYLLRILKYCPTTNDVFLSLLVYFDRMARMAADTTGRTFVIDSYNIHRLVIAGVTVASKFFSDVFYTNSRYAKVGGLPQAELNRLELQFLLLNDFRLTISEQEMQSYAEQLIMFSRTHALPPHQPQPPDASAGSQFFVQPAPPGTHGSAPALHDAHRTPSLHACRSTTSLSTASEADTESQTEFDGSTDDEPTIRPGRAGSVASAASMSEDGGGDSMGSP